MKALMYVTLVAASLNTVHAEPMLYVNAQVLTMDARDSVARAFAVENGRFVAVGSEAHVRTVVPVETRSVDLGGQTVVPGFIDNHIHMIRAAATWKDELRLDGIDTRAGALDRIRRHAAMLSPDAWVYVLGGFSPAQFKDEKSAFTTAELNAATSGRAVYLQVGFQGAFLNEAALARAGLASPKQPVLFAAGHAMQLVKDSLYRSFGQPKLQGALKVTWDIAATGVTTVLDMGGFGIEDQHYVPFQTLADEGRLPIRVRYTRWFTNMEGDPVRGKRTFKRELTRYSPRQGNQYFRLFGAGELLYLPMQDAVGRPASDDPSDLKDMERIYTSLAENRWPLKIHAEDPATIRRHLDAIERVNRTHSMADLRWGFEHADGVTLELLARIKALKMTVALHSRPLLASAGRGPSAGSIYPPLRWVHDSGVRYGIGSDAMMVNGFNPMHSIAWAVTGRAVDGTVVTQQRLTRLEALRAHTINNAWLLGEENRLGSIEKSKLADFVVLDRDVLRVAEDDLKRTRPVAVYVEGKRLNVEARKYE